MKRDEPKRQTVGKAYCPTCKANVIARTYSCVDITLPVGHIRRARYLYRCCACDAYLPRVAVGVTVVAAPSRRDECVAKMDLWPATVQESA